MVLMVDDSLVSFTTLVLESTRHPQLGQTTASSLSEAPHLLQYFIFFYLYGYYPSTKIDYILLNLSNVKQMAIDIIISEIGIININKATNVPYGGRINDKDI